MRVKTFGRASLLVPEILERYTTCGLCGEPDPAALHFGWTPVLCRNCTNAASVPQHRCTICGKVAPAHLHHIGPRKVYPNFVCWVCLSCHAILTRWEIRWRRDANLGHHSLRYLMVGVVNLVTLFLERSPAASLCKPLFSVLGRAVSLLLGTLTCTALESWGLALETLSRQRED